MCVISCSEAQEIRDFYTRGGARLLALSPGQGTEQDLLAIRQLSYPKINPTVWQKLQVIEADTYWRVQSSKKKAISTERLTILERSASDYGMTGILANVSLGDYLWIRDREIANFSRAKSYYDGALRLVAERGEPILEDVIEHILTSVITPPWQRPKLPYGSLQNFLAAESIGRLRNCASSSLREQLGYMFARSLLQEGAPEEQVCSAFAAALKAQKRSPVKALTQFEYAQYVSVGERCGQSSSGLLRGIIKEYKSHETPYVERAKGLLNFAAEGGWSLSVLNRRTGDSETVVLRGPDKGKAQVKIEEVGLVTDEELERRKIAQTPWVHSPGALLKLFTSPVKSIINRQIPSGPVPASRTLPTGPYLVELVGKDERRFFLISDLLVLLRRESQKIQLLSVSLKTGTALPDVQIEVERRMPAGLKSRRVRENLQTDATGLAEITAPRRPCAIGIECESEELVIIGKKFRHTAFMGVTEQNVVWPFQGDPSFWVVLSSEILKRGDLLSWNLFVRPDLLKRFSPGRVDVKLLHHRGTSLSQPSSPLDPFGRAGGVIKLGPTWSSGKFELVYTLRNLQTGESVQESSFFELVVE